MLLASALYNTTHRLIQPPVTLLAILANDAIALPLSPAFPVGELKYIMDNSQAKMLLASEKFESKARGIVEAGLDRVPVLAVMGKFMEGGSAPDTGQVEDLVGGSNGGMMLYTSGTTNRPVRSLFSWLRLRRLGLGRLDYTAWNGRMALTSYRKAC